MAFACRLDIIPMESRAAFRRQRAKLREEVVDARVMADRSIAESKSLMAAADAAMAMRPRPNGYE
jgi:hypothetical protein